MKKTLPINQIICGDCLEVMRDWPDNCIPTIICDPPYGLSFMGKKWDYDVPSIEIWRECLRVLKPGGTALIFAGSRTQHRMACNVEDAGFTTPKEVKQKGLTIKQKKYLAKHPEEKAKIKNRK